MPKPGGKPPGSMSSQLGSPDVSSMMQQAMAQKGSSGQASSGSGGQMPSMNNKQAQQMMKQMGGKGAGQGQVAGAQQQARSVGSPLEEAKRMVTDVPKEITDNVTTILGLGKANIDPEKAAKMKQFHGKWQQLTQQEQMAAQERIQKEQARKQQMEQEEQMKKQKEMQEKQNKSLQMPTGKQSGQKAVQKMQDDRQRMGGASG